MLSYIPEIAFLALVVVAILVRMPLAIFASVAILIYLLSFVFGRMLQEGKRERFISEKERLFSFHVTGESLAFTGDFNFRDITMIEIKNGEIDVEISVSEDNKRIVGIKLEHKTFGAMSSVASFIVPVD